MNAMCDDKYSVHKMCPDVHLMCELQVRMTLYRAACSLSDADSHFFRNQNNSCSRILSNKSTIAQVYIGTNVKIGKEYLAGTLREFSRTLYQIVSVNLPATFFHLEGITSNLAQEATKKNFTDFKKTVRLLSDFSQ